MGVVYTYTGGLKSVIATEALQFSLIVASVAILTLMTANQVPDLDEAWSNAIAKTADAFSSQTWLSLLGLALLFFCGETLIPPYANRALASASSRVSRRGFVLAGLFALPWFAFLSYYLSHDSFDDDMILVWLFLHLPGLVLLFLSRLKFLCIGSVTLLVSLCVCALLFR